MKALKEMTQEQLRYLKQKWSSEIIEINRMKIRAQTRLNHKLDKQIIDKAEIVALALKLEKANTLLKHLLNTNASDELIAAQDEVVAECQKDYNAESNALNILTDEEAQIEQLEIDELNERKLIRQAKINELEALLT